MAPWSEMAGGVYSATRRVVAAHQRHFLAVTAIFLLPASLLVNFFPFLLPYLSRPQPLLRSSSNANVLLPCILYASGVLFLLLAATAVVSSSAHRRFFGRPVRLLPALCSLPSAFLRLLLTLLIAAPVPVALSFALLSLRSLFPSHPLFHILLYPLPFLVLLLFQLNWSIAPAISVIESSWGFGPLRRGFHLISGMRLASLVLNFLFALVTRTFLGGQSYRSILIVVVNSVFLAVMLLNWMVMSTVLYMFCKAVHGELEEEIVREFGWDYVCLPFDEQKVPRLVSVAPL